MVVFLQSLLFLFMVALSFFLILIILLQRGKGGGLVGAFGGMGGNSAFGAKTGDVFMRITVVAAIIWFVTCIGGRFVLDMKRASLADKIGAATVVAPKTPVSTDASATPASTDAATTPVSTDASATPASTDASSTPASTDASATPVSTETSDAE